jgi:hypothetical protein
VSADQKTDADASLELRAETIPAVRKITMIRGNIQAIF